MINYESYSSFDKIHNEETHKLSESRERILRTSATKDTRYLELKKNFDKNWISKKVKAQTKRNQKALQMENQGSDVSFAENPAGNS